MRSFRLERGLDVRAMVDTAVIALNARAHELPAIERGILPPRAGALARRALVRAAARRKGIAEDAGRAPGRLDRALAPDSRPHPPVIRPPATIAPLGGASAAAVRTRQTPDPGDFIVIRRRMTGVSRLLPTGTQCGAKYRRKIGRYCI